MIHQVLGGFSGQGSDVEIHANELLRIGDVIYKIMAEHTGKSVKQIKKMSIVTIFLPAKRSHGVWIADAIHAKRQSSAEESVS